MKKYYISLFILVLGIPAFTSQFFEFSVFRENFPSKNLILPIRENLLRTNIIGVKYLNPCKDNLKFRLLYFYNNWIEVKGEKKVTFSKLLPEEYGFEMYVQNNDGIWKQKIAQLNITIKKPFYLQLYAIIIYIFLITTVTIFTIKSYCERKRLKNEVMNERILRDNLELLNQMKAQFLTGITHEFRTPLTLILGPLNQLINKYSDDPDTLYLLKILNRNTIRLQSLINQIIDFKNLELKKIKNCPKRINVIKLCYQVLDCFILDARDKNIDISIETPFTELYLHTDPDKLDKILMNLLSNSIKFTPENGIIKIEINHQYKDEELTIYSTLVGEKIEGPIIKITVSDTGTGMDPVELNRYFDRFYQEGGYESTGTGIGLHMIKEYTLLLGGYIGINSIPAKGTAISICFPYHLMKIQEKETIKPKTVKREIMKNDMNNSTPLETETDLKTILIVEDDTNLRNYLYNMLSKEFRVITAGNGQQGLEKALVSRPDLILTDLVLPLSDGLEMNRMLKENPVTQHIPIIVLTAKVETDTEINSLKSGADVFLIKPFRDDLLLAYIHNLIRRRKSYSYFENIEKNLLADSLSPNQLFLEKANRIIKANLTSLTFDVDILASDLHMSRATLHRKLKALTGQSATEFIRNIRLKKSVEMMEKGSFSIEEVGIAAGFNSHSYFTHCFKQYYGKTPSRYLAEIRSIRKNKVD